MIKKFNSIDGRYIEKIYGQDRFGYAKSDFEDIYDLIEWSKLGEYPGNELFFYDFEKGKVYKPFDKERNIVYGNPVFENHFLYFLQGDYVKKKVSLYRYFPERVLEKVIELEMEEVNLYNLTIIGDPLYVISQDAEDGFCCYYPNKISFPLNERESVVLIDDDKIYIERWIEEGWDEENNCRTDKYKYYTEIVVKDFLGKTIEKYIGCLNKHSNGEWWIS
ncbi:hypothetical protein [Faecalimonas sp.]